MDKSTKFATAFNCIDGRAQEPVRRFMQWTFGTDFVDMITYPGVDAVMSVGANDELLQHAQISFAKHGSRLLAVVGHFDCAGNPVDRNSHHDQIKKSVDFLKTKFREMEVIGLWVNEKWRVERVV